MLSSIIITSTIVSLRDNIKNIHPVVAVGTPPCQGLVYGSYNGGNNGPSNGWDIDSGYNESKRNKEREEGSRYRKKD